MRRVTFVAMAGLALTSVFAASGHAADKLRVVATTTDLKALTEAVGGDLVEVDALARGSQNAHDLEVRPTLMVKVRRADALVMNGLELDGWADVVVQGANNPNVIPGAIGRIDASQGIPVLEVPTTRVDRSMGDVHPVGNPHYTVDPGMAPLITANIVAALARIAPQHRATFESRRQEFLARLDQAMVQWTETLAPVKGTKVVVDHNMWIYFLTRFGIVQAGTVEERPGIPATPAHLARLIQAMKSENVKLVISLPWSDQKLAAWVAEEAGGRMQVLASAVGAAKGTDTYIEFVNYNVKSLAQGLK
jgi:zinc/manganese transport system substrate-binding protein